MPVERVLHAPAVHFKGSGFYNTDYGTRKRQRENAAASSEESSAEGLDSSSGDSGKGPDKGSSDSSGSDGKAKSEKSSSGIARQDGKPVAAKS